MLYFTDQHLLEGIVFIFLRCHGTFFYLHLFLCRSCGDRGLSLKQRCQVIYMNRVIVNQKVCTIRRISKLIQDIKRFEVGLLEIFNGLLLLLVKQILIRVNHHSLEDFFCDI
ncbi:transmembrane protein, putative (macronuclear) [Tetrahymena thermophila SB210]|uniref:Transmembrane protein, putative n=1 Tax=Tetrahymena thermophila (strain SB210) TaxID=312017 RepID=W7X1R9_TETTS|nr:transmembrane protein, putative [Tetrahymena thermophila SB210]EWS73190.1 transmembrane protein, putative [Tetrahymena thermophila SB210]|eukprot:XP_012654266.1 transmembrane protein, putative [Tetrahymena thermophila SB210]